MFFVFRTILFAITSAMLLGGCAFDPMTRRGDLLLGWTWAGFHTVEKSRPNVRRASRAKRLKRRALPRASPQTPDIAMDEAEYARNLDACLKAISPYLCINEGLKPADRQRVDDAQYAANRARCLADVADTLCVRELLRAVDVRAVEDADYQRNLAQCRAAPERSTCRRDGLKTADRAEIEKLEYDGNLRNCLAAFSNLCRRERLTAPDQARVDRLNDAASDQPLPPSEPETNTGMFCGAAPCPAAGRSNDPSPAMTVPAGGGP
jgi:hypothetical protein